MRVPRLTGPSGPKRPWLAAVLALVVTGLGHAYLRRWLRGFGWFAATFAAVVLLVPPEVVEAMGTGAPIDDPTSALPPAFVVVASAVDAYLLARRTNTQAAARHASDAGAVAANAPAHGGDPEAGAAACPNCGQDLDPELDFCPWCTTELSRPGPNGPDPDGSDR
ncbi:zinc ribbon domain-containing protein [Halobaculum marinum]|uniref:Zinc ribbon domain-containing protein n=1 Tax=Halobaculum marinum TaxID=3031996 RepID=A0ABD5WZ24_9EURY|nr:zinc ribbon domain-containing protein [Halobaculum sp. DT55]